MGARLSGAVPRSISYLKIVNSYDCARGCSYCYNPILGQDVAPDPQRLRRQLIEFLNSQQSPVSVEFIGGEPLQASNLQDTLELLALVRSHPSCANIFMSSAILSSKALDRALPFVDTLYLSLDFSNVYNRKPVTDRQLRAVVDVARRNGTFVSASSVLQGDESFDDMWRFSDRLLTAGITGWGLTHTSYVHLSKTRMSRTKQQYYDLFRIAIVRSGELNVYNGILDSLTTLLRGGKKSSACECGDISVLIEPDGRMSAGVCQDHVSGARHPKQFNDLQAERFERLRVGECAGCPLWSVCYGGCMTEANRLGGSPMSRSEVECELLTSMWSTVSADIRALPD